jgi:hypothetical protein
MLQCEDVKMLHIFTLVFEGKIAFETEYVSVSDSLLISSLQLGSFFDSVKTLFPVLF